MGCATIVGFLIADFGGALLVALKLNVLEEVELVDENCGNFYECVSLLQRKKLFTQEMHFKRNLQIETMGDYAMEQLRTVHGQKKVIKNYPAYEILVNLDYA